MKNRYDRNIKFFGKMGQDIIGRTRVAIVGIGGIGTHVVQQLAHLGVKTIVLIDKEKFDKTNSNRYVGSTNDDLINLPFKVEIGKRIINSINPEIEVITINKTLVSDEAYCEIIKSDYVFGCIDREGIRFILNELCSAYDIPYFDLATDIVSSDSLRYGGRISCNLDGKACLHCMEILDIEEVQRDLGGADNLALENAIYGVKKNVLGAAGPSVVSINGVIASFAITEFIVSITKIRKPVTLATYRAQESKVLVSIDKTRSDCYYCNFIRGKKENADVERYIRNGVGNFL